MDTQMSESPHIAPAVTAALGSPAGGSLLSKAVCSIVNREDAAASPAEAKPSLHTCTASACVKDADCAIIDSRKHWRYGPLSLQRGHAAPRLGRILKSQTSTHSRQSASSAPLHFVRLTNAASNTLSYASLKPVLPEPKAVKVPMRLEKIPIKTRSPQLTATAVSSLHKRIPGCAGAITDPHGLDFSVLNKTLAWLDVLEEQLAYYRKSHAASREIANERRKMLQGLLRLSQKKGLLSARQEASAVALLEEQEMAMAYDA